MGARGRRGGDREENVWTPVTKLGRLVKDGKISSLEEIFLFSLPVKEAEIIDYFLKDKIQDEVIKIMPVQKQSSAGQRTRFKAFVALGDTSGHIGLGVKCASEVATAIRGAITAAKLNVSPVRRGYWGRKGNATYRTMQSNWKMWISTCETYSRTSWNRSCLFTCWKEAYAYGRYSRLLHVNPWPL